MTTVKVVEDVDAAADAVWTLLSDFGDIQVGGAIEAFDIDGPADRVGTVRTIRLANGTVIERLEEHDAAARTFTYAITNEDCPLPVRNYSATVHVRDRDGGATVEWTGTFEPRGDEDAAIKVIRGIYTGAIEGARRCL